MISGASALESQNRKPDRGLGFLATSAINFTPKAFAHSSAYHDGKIGNSPVFAILPRILRLQSYHEASRGSVSYEQSSPASSRL